MKPKHKTMKPKHKTIKTSSIKKQLQAKVRSTLTALTICGLTLTNALSADVAWTGAEGDDNWFNGLNWDTGNSPGLNDTAYFTTAATFVFNQDVSIQRIRPNAAAANVSIDLSGTTMTWGAGELSNYTNSNASLLAVENGEWNASLYYLEDRGKIWLNNVDGSWNLNEGSGSFSTQGGTTVPSFLLENGSNLNISAIKIAVGASSRMGWMQVDDSILSVNSLIVGDHNSNQNGSKVSVINGGTLINTGALNLGPSATSTSRNLLLEVSGEGSRYEGSGNIVLARGTVGNSNKILASDNGWIENDGSVTLGGLDSSTTGGILEATTGGTIAISGALDAQGFSQINVSGDGRIEVNSATISANTSVNVTHGTLMIGNGGSTWNSSYSIASGANPGDKASLTLAGGNHNFGANALTVNEGAQLTAHGTITASTVEIQGQFQVGGETAPGTANINGTVFLSSTSEILFRIGGESNFDQLVLNGDAAFGDFLGSGQITISLLANPALTIGQSFDILDWTGNAPDFSAFDAGSAFVFNTPGVEWNTSSFTTDGTITVTAVPEPSTFALIGLGLTALAMRFRGKRVTA